MHLQVLEGFTSFCSPHHCAAYHSRLVRTPHASYPETLFQQIQQLWFGDFGSGRRTRYSDIEHHRMRHSLILLLLTALLFIPIRGGFTVSTTNTGKAYFSQNAFWIMLPSIRCSACLNHLPIRKILHRNTDTCQKKKLTSSLLNGKFKRPEYLPAPEWRSSENGKPDILIIMESFANDIMPSVGTHKDVAVCLDSIAKREFSSQDSIPTLSARIVVWLLFWAVILHNLQPASCATRQNLHNYHHWHVHWLKQSITAMHIIMVVMLILPTNALGWFPRAMRESFQIVISL